MSKIPRLTKNLEGKNDYCSLKTIQEEREIVEESTNENTTTAMNISVRLPTSSWEDSCIESPSVFNKAFFVEKSFRSENNNSPPSNGSKQENGIYQSTPNPTSNSNGTFVSCNGTADFCNLVDGDCSSNTSLNWSFNNSTREELLVPPARQSLSPDNRQVENERKEDNVENWQARLLAEETETYLALAFTHGDRLCKEEISVSDISGFCLGLEIEEIENLIHKLQNGTIFNYIKALEYELKFNDFLGMVKDALKASPNHEKVEVLIKNLESKLQRLKICEKDWRNVENILSHLDWLKYLERQESETLKPPFSKSADVYSTAYSVQEMKVKLKARSNCVHVLKKAQERFANLGVTLCNDIQMAITGVIERYSLLSNALDSLQGKLSEEKKKLGKKL